LVDTDGGYHGYWAKDLYEVNSKYGTKDDLKDLVKAAHGKVRYAANQPWIESYTDCLEYLRHGRRRRKPHGQGYPKPQARAPHVEKSFWPDFQKAAGVFAIGEVWDGSPDYLAGYSKVMPGLLNYAMYYPMNRFYQQKGDPSAVVDMYNEISQKFDDPTQLGTFIDNHDNARWLSQKNDKALLKNALAFTILARGIPIVYYGTEQGYAGGNDPANREDLWRSNFSTDSDLYQTISKLGKARSAVGGLAGNDQKFLKSNDSALIWSRADGDLIVVTLNRGKGYSGEYCFNTGKNNKTWDRVLGQGSVKSDGNGQLCVSYSNGEPEVLVAA